jgi:heme-degrading monooxygenase HmoA
MTAQLYHLAQVNIARMRAPLTDPVMAEFVARLDEINALADDSPGFVWRLQTAEGNATYLRPYEDERILFNLSVWESIEQLKEYVYRNAHHEVMRQRRQWFEKFDGMYAALWWIDAGHLPTVEEAKRRLEYLQQHGDTAHAFTFKRIFLPTERAAGDFITFSLNPCQAS